MLQAQEVEVSGVQDKQCVALTRAEAEAIILRHMRGRACAPYLCVVECQGVGRCVVDWHRWEWRVRWLEEDQVVQLEAMR